MKEYSITQAESGYVVKHIGFWTAEHPISYGTMWAFGSLLEAFDFINKQFDGSPLLLNPEAIYQPTQNSDYSNEESPDVEGDLPY